MNKLFISSLFVTAALLAQTPATSANGSQSTDQTTKTTKVKKHRKSHAKKGDSTTTIAPETKAPASK